MQSQIAVLRLTTLCAAISIFTFLSGCASARLEREVSALESRFHLLSAVRGSYTEFNWVGETDSRDSPALSEALDRTIACGEPAVSHMNERSAKLKQTANLYSLDHRYTLGRAIVDEMLAAYDKCAAHEGITAKPILVVGDGQAIPLSNWLDELYSTGVAYDQASSNLVSARQSEHLLAQAFAAGLSGLATPYNPDVVPVRPYLRQDGTPVQGHIRTAPNATCADNFNGCP